MNIEVIFRLRKGKPIIIQCAKDFGEEIKDDMNNPEVMFIDLETTFINKEDIVSVKFVSK